MDWGEKLGDAIIFAVLLLVIVGWLLVLFSII
jgi:hypothetical protein